MNETVKKYVLKEATRKRCKIIKADESVLKKFMPISLELYPYLKEVAKIDFSVFFRNGDEIVEFMRPQELSQDLLDQMWAASLKATADIEICLQRVDYPKFEAVINEVRDKKIKAVLEKDGTLDHKVMEVYSTLSSASQLIVRGGINSHVANVALKATASLMSSQIDSSIAIGTLSRMIHCDSTLYDHSASVAMLSGVIASSFMKTPLDKKESELVAQCGLYHDAGKSCVPNHILNKPGKFTDEEFEIMKTHTEYGYDELEKAMQKGAPIDPLAATVALEHHERFTGKGYPHCKVGRAEENENGIHKYARIVSIADVYSALLMKRVYKEALSSDEAIELMRKISENDFDPDIFNPFYVSIKKSIEVFKVREEQVKAQKTGQVKMIDEKDSFSQAVLSNKTPKK